MGDQEEGFAFYCFLKILLLQWKKSTNRTGKDEKVMKLEQLEKLLQDMSLEEKVGQMVQIPANMLTEGGLLTGPTDTMEMSEETTRLVGSILGKTGAEELHNIQKEFVENHPHHIPLLLMYDVINGMETIFPIPLAQGCTFSPELVERAAHAAAKEATATGLHVTFSPMLDLVRDARWGRVMESTGEDPWLNAELGRAMVRGYQGSSKVQGELLDLAKEGNIAGCVKHFAGYGAPLGGREYENVELSERTFREDYLPAYQAAIEEGCVMVMTSFNTLNRIPSSGNQWLMRKVLREEMGFDGVLISDYSAVDEMIRHGIAEDSREAAKLAILAGVDMDMVSNAYVKYLAELVRDGEVEERLVDEAVWRILKLKNDLGLFENPYKDGAKEKEEILFLCPEHRGLAREMAAKSFVLLKNDEILPLEQENAGTIALIGPYADSTEMFGAWSFPKRPEQGVTIKQGMEVRYGSVKVCRGCFMQDEDKQTKFGVKEKYTTEELETLLAEAEKLAGKSETVVLCLGEHREYTGEGASRTEIGLPKHQLELLKRVQAVNKNVVTVVFSGRPLVLTEVVELSRAVLLVWMPGTEGGSAIADVLSGAVLPEGKLSMTLPRCVGQVPVFYNKFRTGRPNEEGTTVGYIHGYIDESIYPLYPFGYGLTYTTFGYSKVSVSQEIMKKTETIAAKATVTNTGTREAVETVQMYLTDVKGSVVRPVKMLRGFKKVALKPGESRKVTFTITEDMLKFYDSNMVYTSEPGEFEVYIGPDSDTKNKAVFRLV